MKLLVGSTGLIGTTLRDSVNFDFLFNTQNIFELPTLNTDNNDDVYLSCLPATKWLINQDPKSDFDNIINIVKVLEQRKYKNIILYSTIDVYNNAPLGSDEDYIPNITSFNYGNNRYLFEILVKERLKYDNLLILRLPALFGKHIKKNIVYDLINKNQVDKIKYNSKFQWYDLDNLILDTNKYLKQAIESSDKILQINIFPEPIPTSEILDLFKVKKLEVDTSTTVEYNYKTKFTKSGYTHNKEEILNTLKKFINKSYEIRNK